MCMVDSFKFINSHQFFIWHLTMITFNSNCFLFELANRAHGSFTFQREKKPSISFCEFHHCLAHFISFCFKNKFRYPNILHLSRNPLLEHTKNNVLLCELLFKVLYRVNFLKQTAGDIIVKIWGYQFVPGSILTLS